MSVPNPEALSADRLSTREFADAQLRNPDLTPGEHRVAWFLYRRSSKPLTSDAPDGVASFYEGES